MTSSSCVSKTLWPSLCFVLLGGLAIACTATPAEEGASNEGGTSGGGGEGEGGGGEGGGVGGSGVEPKGGSGGMNQQGSGGKDAGVDAPVATDGAAKDAETTSAVYDPCPAKGTPCKVMPLGDSITETSEYRVALYRKAKAANRLMTYVGSKKGGPSVVDGGPFPQQHEGHSAYMVDGIAGLIVNSLAANDPHIVLLMIGTNDAHRSSQIATAPERVGRLVDTIAKESPAALIVVAKLVPTSEIPGSQFYSAGNNQRVQTFNAALAQQMATRIAAGKHVVVVDMYAAFTANPNYKVAYMADHLHPNGPGYTVMANVWWDAISPVLK